MTQAIYRFGLKATLLACALVAAPAVAFSQESLEDRVDRLETRLDLILRRMDEGATLSPADREVLVESAAVLRQQAAATRTSAQGPAHDEPPMENGFQMGKTRVTFGGFVKLDTTVTEFSDGTLPTTSIGRDFYVPGAIPVGGEGGDPVLDFNPRETRFLFGLDTDHNGHKISGRIELDFQVTSGGDERVSNSYTPRIRQAYVEIDNWLVGQAWSTFQDVAALPDNLDFIGPAESTVFVRQPQIRYTHGGLQVAVEEPETTISDMTNGGARITPGEDFAPDVVARYNWRGDWGHVTVAGIGRMLNVEEGAAPGAQEDTAWGYGGSVSGKVKVGARDDVRFMATAGDGVGRYIGLNTANDAIIDADGELEPIATLSGFVSYRHFWSPKWRSNATYGVFQADTPEVVNAPLTERAQSGHLNLIYSPMDKVDVGLELIYAERRLDNDDTGSMQRAQFSVKYGF